MDEPDRPQLHFARKVRGAFQFLIEEGFAELEALPTLVRYRKGEVEVDICHGRQSYEIGGGISLSGIRYALSEIVRASDFDAAETYRNPVAKTPAGIAAGLEELSELMQRYGRSALRNDLQFCSVLQERRKQWADEYALDVLEDQLRPRAEDAFRRGDFSKAAELYGRFRKRLSPAEAQKLALAERRSRGS